MSEVATSYEVLDAQPIDVAAVLMMVWRPWYHQWLVHAIGNCVEPAEVPRTAV